MTTELEPITPDDAVELYLADKQSEYAAATHRSHRSRLKHFIKWCEIQEITNLNTLSGRDIQQYRLWRRADGDLAPASEKCQMSSLRVFIQFCESIDAVTPDLSTKVMSPSLSDSQAVRDEMVEADAAAAILDRLSTYEYASRRHVCFRLLWRTGIRRGSLVALDVTDYSATEQSLEVKHRPETGTPLKAQGHGERFIALSERTCEVLNAWLADRRPNVTDEAGRNPLLATRQGRIHPTTVQAYVYSATKPCFFTDECPHGREMEDCTAANDRTEAWECPSSLSPHTVRRGAITHWLSSDLPEAFASDRASVMSEVLNKHYDRRTEEEKMEQRRKYLDDI